jgi:LysR family transcriptional regulator, glycine cleavage system transcriptional activator
MVLSAAEAGLGTVLLRLPLARAWLDDGRLVSLGLREIPNPNAHYICTRTTETRPAVTALRDRLRSARK